VYPLKSLIVAGLVIGEILFFVLDSSYAFGLWLGLIISIIVSYAAVSQTVKYLEVENDDDKISWKVGSFAMFRFLLYGAALVISALTSRLNFFATAGGLVLPTAALQINAILNGQKFGGNDA